MSLRTPLLLYVVVNVLEYLASGPENQDRLPLLQKFHFLSVGISSVGEFSLLQFSSQDQDGSPSATQAFFPEHADQCAPASHSPGRFLVIRNEAGFIFNPLCPARMLPSPLTHWITFSSNKYSIYEACCRWTSHARLLLPWMWCPVDPRNTRRWLPRGNLWKKHLEEPDCIRLLLPRTPTPLLWVHFSHRWMVCFLFVTSSPRAGNMHRMNCMQVLREYI